MVDAILLLVDAAEGPLPQTRYVLQKALARYLPAVVAINKIDRGDARPSEVLDAIYELFIDLGASAEQLDFPVLYTNAKAGTATTDLARRAPTCGRCSTPWWRPRRRRPTCPGTRFSCWSPTWPPTITSGRMAIGRIWNGTLQHGPAHRRSCAMSRTRTDGAVEPGRTTTLTGNVTSLTTAQGIERIDIAEAGPGEIVAVAGIPDVTIGDTHHRPGSTRGRCRACRSTNRRCA